MSYKDDHVKLNEEQVKGHDNSRMKKHLTMKYNMKELRMFTDLEMWIGESLEELIPDDRKRPTLEVTSLAQKSEKDMIKFLRKELKSLKPEEERDIFIEDLLRRFKKLPAGILEEM